MADKDVKIRIDTEANTQGAKEAQQSIASLKNEAKALEAELETAAIGSKQFEETAEKLGLVERRIKEAGDQARTFARKSGEAKDSSRNMGGAILELSRGFEDLQYGVRGVLNNIPGLIAQLGGGAGLAGVVSLVAVGASILIPKLLEMGDNAEKSQSKFKGFKEALSAIKKQQEDLKEFEAGLDKKTVVDAYEDATKAIDTTTNAIKANIEAFKSAVQANLQLSKIETDRNITDIQGKAGRGEIIASDAEKQIADLKKKQAQTEIDAIRLAGQANVAASEADQRAAEEKKRQAETSLVKAREEFEAREKLATESIKKMIEIGQALDKNSAQQREIGATAGIAPDGASRQRAADALIEAQKEGARLKQALEELVKSIDSPQLRQVMEETLKSQGWSDFRTEGVKIGEAAQKFSEALEKGAAVFKSESTDDLKSHVKKLGDEVKEAAEKLNEANAKLSQTQGLEAQNAEQSVRTKLDQSSAQVDVAFQRESQSAADKLAAKINGFIDSISAKVPDAQSNTALQSLIGTLQGLIQGGIQPEEMDQAQAELQKMAGMAQADYAAKTKLFSEINGTFSEANKLNAQIIQALATQKSAINEMRNAVKTIEANQGHPSY